MTGHLLGASGAVEAVATVKVISFSHCFLHIAKVISFCFVSCTLLKNTHMRFEKIEANPNLLDGFGLTVINCSLGV